MIENYTLDEEERLKQELVDRFREKFRREDSPSSLLVASSYNPIAVIVGGAAEGQIDPSSGYGSVVGLNFFIIDDAFYAKVLKDPEQRKCLEKQKGIALPFLNEEKRLTGEIRDVIGRWFPTSLDLLDFVPHLKYYDANAFYLPLKTVKRRLHAWVRNKNVFIFPYENELWEQEIVLLAYNLKLKCEVNRYDY